MFCHISSRLIESLVENNIIKENEIEYYQYSLTGFFEICFNLLFTLFIGLFIERFFETVIFLITIIPLRSVAGGIHAEKEVTCFIVSITVYIFSLLLSQHINVDILISLCVFILLSILIGILTPVDSIHKVLNDEVILKQKKTYEIISLFNSVIFILLICFKLTRYYKLILVIMTVVFITQALGIVKNKVYRKNHSGI